MSEVDKQIACSEIADESVSFPREELYAWLAMDNMSGSGLGFKRAKIMLEFFGSIAQAFKAPESDFKHIRGIPSEVIAQFISRRDKSDGEALFAQLQESRVKAYPYTHPLYPYRLREIFDPPLIIYMRGDLHPDELRCALAIVGTRKPSSYGRKLAKDFARKLSLSGATVVSGMAIGVDSLAHWGALEAGGRTVSVLACGPDYCYPSSNRPLYSRILDHSRGAVISEFFPGTRPEPWRFPARNRIISGLCQATLVIEAGSESGALITARIAFEQSREVFAIPGRIDNPMSEGTNSLIAKQTAQLVSSPEDILAALNWASSPLSKDEIPAVVELMGREREIYDLLSTEPTHFDHICVLAEMGAGELSATLTMLELAGLVTRHPGEWYSRESPSFVGT